MKISLLFSLNSIKEPNLHELNVIDSPLISKEFNAHFPCIFSFNFLNSSVSTGVPVVGFPPALVSSVSNTEVTISFSFIKISSCFVFPSTVVTISFPSFNSAVKPLFEFKSTTPSLFTSYVPENC